jgi:hypothetical protein
MQPQTSIPPIPPDTARAAKSVYSPSNFYLATGDRLERLLSGIHFNSSSSIEARYHLGKPLLCLATFFQYLEKLTDSQAADATTARIDWKYALHLPMNYPGLNPTAFCDFRQSLLRHPDKRQVYQQFLDRLWESTYPAGLEAGPIEVLRLLDEVCLRTRLAKIIKSMRNVLQALATCYPEWLRRTSLPYWYTRYEEAQRHTDLTMSMEQQKALAEAIGADIVYLLEAIQQSNNPGLVGLNEAQELNLVWREQFDPFSRDGLRLYPYCYFCGNAPQDAD